MMKLKHEDMTGIKAYRNLFPWKPIIMKIVSHFSSALYKQINERMFKMKAAVYKTGARGKGPSEDNAQRS